MYENIIREGTQLFTANGTGGGASDKTFYSRWRDVERQL